jgi:phage tail-like protein
MAELKPITISRFYFEANGLENKMLKSVQEVAFQGQTTGSEKALASTKDGKTLRQSTSAGFEENPNITIEVYLAQGDMDFYNWFQAVMPTDYAGAASGEGKWADNRKDCTITAYDPADAIILQWNLTKAWPKSYKVSDWESGGNAQAVETFELVCEDIRRVK